MDNVSWAEKVPSRKNTSTAIVTSLLQGEQWVFQVYIGLMRHMVGRGQKIIEGFVYVKLHDTDAKRWAF